jgi:hypothetical protein
MTVGGGGADADGFVGEQTGIFLFCKEKSNILLTILIHYDIIQFW